MPDTHPFDSDAAPQPARLLAEERAGDNAGPISVSDLAQRLKRTVEDRFGHVRVRGEISGFKRAASGHLYCALKDADAVLDAVMWKGAAARLPFRPEDGLDVIATGKITTYPGRSKYQIVVDSFELAGEGALLALLEKTKARLRAEGLFDVERKRPLPYLPRTIGIVTSPTGAVIRDILHRLGDRFPVHVLVWPVLVQGDSAAGQVAAAIRGFDALPADGAIPRPDLVIVARGGGSIEDLWAFNEEDVVRAVADCTIPLISAVGHETDTTLIDLASDQRAPTPTAAAEMAVPVRADLAAHIADLDGRARRSWAQRRASIGERIDMVSARLPLLDRLLLPQRQRLDEWSERLPQAYRLRLSHAREAVAQAAAPLRPALLHRQVERARDRLASLTRVAASLDPRIILTRGYALVSDAAGRVVTSAATARTHAALTLEFADGSVGVAVGRGGESSAPPVAPVVAPAAPRRSKPAANEPRQSGLFD